MLSFWEQLHEVLEFINIKMHIFSFMSISNLGYPFWCHNCCCSCSVGMYPVLSACTSIKTHRTGVSGSEEYPRSREFFSSPGTKWSWRKVAELVNQNYQYSESRCQSRPHWPTTPAFTFGKHGFWFFKGFLRNAASPIIWMAQRVTVSPQREVQSIWGFWVTKWLWIWRLRNTSTNFFHLQFFLFICIQEWHGIKSNANSV